MDLSTSFVRRWWHVEWISVKDRLPEFYDWVLVAVESVAGPSIIVTAYRNRLVKMEDWHWWWFGYPSEIGEVTHWMPLPPPPEGSD